MYRDRESKGLLEVLFSSVAYIVAGVLGMGFAFFLATSFVQQGASQTPSPPDQKAAGATSGDIVAEAEEARKNFMAEVESYLEPFIYDPKGRRDPFTPFEELKAERDGFEGPLLPLQRFDLEQLNLLGIIWNINEPKAMFRDPTSEIHVVGLEERVGRKNGYIAVIREGEVVVVEASRRKGEIIYTSRVLRIEQ